MRKPDANTWPYPTLLMYSYDPDKEEDVAVAVYDKSYYLREDGTRNYFWSYRLTLPID